MSCLFSTHTTWSCSSHSEVLFCMVTLHAEMSLSMSPATASLLCALFPNACAQNVLQTFQVLQHLAARTGSTGSIELIWLLPPRHAMLQYLLCFPWISNPRGPSEGTYDVPVGCWFDSTDAGSRQACRMCETQDSTNCSTSGQDGAGVADADFVVYVAARSFQCGGATLAYAAHCFQDKTTDRYSS